MTQLYNLSSIDSASTKIAMPQLYHHNHTVNDPQPYGALTSFMDDRNDFISTLDSDGDSRTVLGEVYGPIDYDLYAILEANTAFSSFVGNSQGLYKVHWDGDSLVKIGEEILWTSYLKGLADNEVTNISTYIYSDSSDSINISSGASLIYSFGGNDTIYSAVGNGYDRIFSGSGNDKVYSRGGQDLIILGQGDDVAYGGDHNDVISGDEGNDKIYGQNGNDILFGGEGNDTAVGGSGDDEIYGGFGNDILYGGDGNDYISGSGGDDKLYGDKGNDVLIGGEGLDWFKGGTGADTFTISAPAENGTQRDYISDYNRAEGDKLDISDILDMGPSDDITDFLKINALGNNQYDLRVNVDGLNNDFQSYAVVKSTSDITDVQDLYTNNLIIA